MCRVLYRLLVSLTYSAVCSGCSEDLEIIEPAAVSHTAWRWPLLLTAREPGHALMKPRTAAPIVDPSLRGAEAAPTMQAYERPGPQPTSG